MRIKATILAGLGLMMLGAAPAFADKKIYPYHTYANFCPAGLQPVTISGTISCGTPNQYQSYQHVMMHPAPRRKVRVHHGHNHFNCPVGTKGCN